MGAENQPTGGERHRTIGKNGPAPRWFYLLHVFLGSWASLRGPNAPAITPEHDNLSHVFVVRGGGR